MRKIFPLLLLAGSITVAVMIFAQRTPEKIVSAEAPAELASLKTSAQPESVPALPTAADNQAAQDIGTGIAEEIIANNPDGPTMADDVPQIAAPDPQKIAEKIINERLSQSSFALLTPEINTDAIKVVPNNDPDFINGYLQSAAAISNANFAGINIDFSNPKVEDFKKVADAYDKTIKQYYTLNVPSSMLNLHKEKLKLFMQQEKIFANIANIEKDPLAALVSMRLLGQAYTDLTDLNAKIVQFARNNNL